MSKDFTPRILIIDDLYGRTHRDKRNKERANLCGKYLLKDITGDEEGKGTPQTIKTSIIAQAVFFRGQKPVCSTIGDTVENDLERTLQIIEKGWNESPCWSLVLLDLCFYTGKVTEESDNKSEGMPEGRLGDDDPKNYFGLQILFQIKEKYPNLPVVILSSKPEKEVSLNYTSLGALGFIDRADAEGPDLLKKLIYKHALIPDNSGIIIGHSKALMAALREIRRSAFQKDYRNILFRGETGTGKKLFAEFAHRQRENYDKKPYITVNCPQHSELYMSELFGHKKGAFTDAKEDKKGFVEEANEGDLFLDEIANLPLMVQSGILKVIDERIFYRVGETTPRQVNIRFLAATNANLEIQISKGEFKEDLFYRLTEGGTIFLPALRDRREDISILTNHFVNEAVTKMNVRERNIEEDAIAKLMNYDWPGNIRELQTCIYNAIVKNPDVPHLVTDHIKFEHKSKKTEGHSGMPVQVTTAESVELIDLPASQPSLNKENVSGEGYQEFQLPRIIKEKNRQIVEYIMHSLEKNADRYGTPNYPDTWYSLTKQKHDKDNKDKQILSTEIQRNIGNYIFQLEDADIIQLMRQSTVFRKAVEKCGSKVHSAKKRLEAILKALE